MSIASAPSLPRRRWPWIVAAGAAALVVFMLVWFQPHKLLIDERVDEPVPAVSPEAASPEAASPEAASPEAPGPSPTRPPRLREVARGAFVSLDHGTEGRVRVLDVGDPGLVVRLEGLDTSNGPDLYVYLTTNPATGAESAFDDEYVDLGRLKGNQGDQNYAVPAGTDLERFPTVVIWCDRFDSAFGAAELASP